LLQSSNPLLIPSLSNKQGGSGGGAGSSGAGGGGGGGSGGGVRVVVVMFACVCGSRWPYEDSTNYNYIP